MANENANEEFSWHLDRPEVMSHVRNQKTCYCCVMMAACGACESLYMLETGKKIELSVQEIINCLLVKYPFIKPKSLDNDRCFTTKFRYVFTYIKDCGVAMEADCPFVARREDCNNHAKKPKLFIKDYDEFNEERYPGEILNILRMHPIGGSIPVYENFKQLRNEIYEGPHGQQDEKLGSHSILLTGYGTENGVDYYWFQNSWSTSWGVNGYGKVRRDVVRKFAYPMMPWLKSFR